MKNRTIKQVVNSQIVNMGGIMIDQPLPTRSLQQIDPFLLIHHGSLPLNKNKKQSESGVGPHPHRGFSPVTFVFKGSVLHQDSLGNNTTVYKGGTQWIHAGSGIVHSERPGVDQEENEIIQFWVNTPAKHKMESPYYLPISPENTPAITKENATISIVAGQLENITGPAKTYSPQLLLRVEAEPGNAFPIEIPANFNALIYVLDGELELAGNTISNKTLVWFNNDGDAISVQAKKSTRFIVLSGAPIEEKTVSYGPFVMNTEQEIHQALNDYETGKMGELIERF